MSLTMTRPRIEGRLTINHLKLPSKPAPVVLPVAQAATPQPDKPDRIAVRVAALAAVRARFPELFDIDRPRPLQVGIHVPLSEALGLPPHAINDALRWWTQLPAYRAALVCGGPRYDLAGEVAGIVTPEESEHASQPRRTSGKET